MTEPTTNAEPFIVFELAGTAYGLRSRDVRHLEMLEHVTPVPNAAPFVEGVVFSRGQVIPVVSLRARFGLERAPYDLRTRLRRECRSRPTKYHSDAKIGRTNANTLT